MGVGFFRPIELHILAEGECSTQVEPSPELNQEQAAHPQPEDHFHEQSSGRWVFLSFFLRIILSLYMDHILARGEILENEILNPGD
jgi:hypothetical protein